MFKIIPKRNVPNIILALLCIASILIHTSYAVARVNRRQSRTQDRGASDLRDQQLQSQQEKLSKLAEGAAEQIDSKLVNILELVNKNKKPGRQKIDSALQTVQDSARFLSAFSPEVQCQHHMLKAWGSYFNDDPDTANNAANRAYRTDADNNDAHVTQAAISILTGNKPIVEKTQRTPAAAVMSDTSGRQRQRTSPRRRQTRQTSAAAIKTGGNASTGDILQLDVEAIKPDMLGETIQPLKLNCINATSISCDPSQEHLCLMLWQLPESSEDHSEDPNDPSQKSKSTTSSSTATSRPDSSNMRSETMARRPDRRRPDINARRPGRPDMMDPRMMDPRMRDPRMMDPRMRDPRMMDPRMRDPRMMMGSGMNPYMQFGTQSMSQAPSVEENLQSQMSAFGKIFDSQIDNPQIKFVAVNVDQPESRKKVVDRLLQNPWPWAQVMANEPESGAEKLKDFDAETPVFVIVDKNTTIKYAGPAEGFLASMVLEKTAGITISQEEADTSEIADSNSLPQTTINISEALKQLEANPELMAQITSEGGMLTPEQFQAGKLQSFAEGLFGPAAKKGVITHKQTVELCRRIIKDYPNTPQAEQARQLLRQIPEAERKKYNVTNEEMGL